MSTSSRLLALLWLLQTPRSRSGAELADRLEVSRRTVRRDVDRLRDLGYPVEATVGIDGGYRLGAGATMPPLLLDDDEAVAIAVGLRTAAGSAIEGIDEASVRALAKLEQVLPARLRERFAGIGAATARLDWYGPSVDPETLTLLARAIAAGERVRFVYRAADGTETRRSTEPNGVVVVGRRWYLVAWDEDRGDWRSFRVDRISDPWTLRRSGPSHELPDGLDAVAFVRARTLDQAPTYRMIATIETAAAEVRTKIGEEFGEIEPLGPGRCRLTSAADTLDWLAFRLLLLDAEFSVLEPPELRDHVQGLGERLLRSTGRGPGQHPFAERTGRSDQPSRAFRRDRR